MRTAFLVLAVFAALAIVPATARAGDCHGPLRGFAAPHFQDFAAPQFGFVQPEFVQPEFVDFHALPRHRFGFRRNAGGRRVVERVTVDRGPFGGVRRVRRERIVR